MTDLIPSRAGDEVYDNLNSILVISRVNHEIALRMLAYRAKFWGSLTNDYMSAVRTLPNHILIT